MNEYFLKLFLDCNDTPPYKYGGMKKFFTNFKSDKNQKQLSIRIENLCKKSGIEVVYDNELVDTLANWNPPGNPNPEEFKDVPASTCLAIAYCYDIKDPAWVELRVRDLKKRPYIYMRPPLNDAVAFNVLLHEYCHVSLGHVGARTLSLHEAEAEAEFVCCSVSFNLGIDISALSFGYINHFAKIAKISKQDLVQREILIESIKKISKALQ